MEWEPNERDAWVSDAQRWITQIKGVLQCKIDLDDQGEIAGVHVVAGLDRDPRHIVRDVESLLKARLQMDVYYKKIGVVQVVENQVAVGPERPLVRPEIPGVAGTGGVTFMPPQDAAAPAAVRTPDKLSVPPFIAASPGDAAPPPLTEPQPAILVAEDAFPRLVCRDVTLTTSERTLRAEVRLAAGGCEGTGRAEGANCSDADLSCLARATVEAVGGLLALPVLLHLREIRLDSVGGQATVLVAVDLVEARRTETLLGACALRHNRQQAVVHAVLAALNRRLGLFALREADATG